MVDCRLNNFVRIKGVVVMADLVNQWCNIKFYIQWHSEFPEIDTRTDTLDKAGITHDLYNTTSNCQ